MNEVTRETQIKRHIMRHVYVVWFVRRFGFLFFAGVPLLFFVSIYPLSHVSFGNLLETAVIKLSMLNISGFLLYVFVAARDTQYTLASLSLAGTLALVAFLVKQVRYELSTSYSKRQSLQF